MKEIVIIGAGGFGREVKMLIDQINQIQLVYNFRGYYDDGFEKGDLINGFPILGGVKDINNIDGVVYVVCAIGDPKLKSKLLGMLNNSSIIYPTLIHPNVCIGTDQVEIGQGVIICSNTVITVNVNIEDFTILNLACTVGHDSNIGKYCSFMPGTNISGEVNIGEGVYIGTGAKIINQLEIGEYSIIGAGAVVSKSIPQHCTAVGIPAKPIKFHNE